MEEKLIDKLVDKLVWHLIGAIMVAFLLIIALLRAAEPIHKSYFESERCKKAREIVLSANMGLIDGKKLDKENLELTQTYSSYYNAFCKGPFTFAD